MWLIVDAGKHQQLLRHLMNPHLQRAMVRVIEDQLRSCETPEVRAEYDRLLALGIQEREVKVMMARVVMPHVYRLAQANARFDYAQYLQELRSLPDTKA